MRASRLWDLKKWWVLVIVVSLVPWSAQHLPLVDLPQHAAQVRMLRDSLSGNHLLALNWLTPYLIPYAALYVFSLVLPIWASIALLLQISFLAYSYWTYRLTEEWQSCSAMLWMLPAGYFGFSWKWGFVPWMAAAPMVLWFIFESHKWTSATEVTCRRLLAIGVMLFFSHGYAFVVGLAVGIAMVGASWLRGSRGKLGPFVGLIILPVAYWLLLKLGGDPANLPESPLWGNLATRLIGLVVYPFGYIEDLPLAVLALPLVGGVYAVGAKRHQNSSTAILVATSFMALWFLVPSHYQKTSALFERLSIFLLPCVIWIHKKQDSRNSAGPALLLAVSLVVAGVQVYRNLQFTVESRDANTVIDAIPAGSRVFALMYDRGSNAAFGADTYLHYAQWYQVEKGGLVEFSFAGSIAQPVRFRRDHYPGRPYRLLDHPEEFNCRRHGGSDFSYFVVAGGRSRTIVPLEQQGCSATEVKSAGNWHLFRNTDFERSSP